MQIDQICKDFCPNTESKSADGCPENDSCLNELQICENSFTNVFSSSSKNKINSHNIVICGHRGGAGSHELENTMAAFEKAMEMKLTSIEFDVSNYLVFYFLNNSEIGKVNKMH